MKLEESLTYQQLREEAIKLGIRDTNVMIGRWIKDQGYIKFRRLINGNRVVMYIK